MKIYIASSWKNQLAVEMLTIVLRNRDHVVLSFIEDNTKEGIADAEALGFDFWVSTEASENCFKQNRHSATSADLVIYLEPAGKDAAAEVGMASEKGTPIIGLHAEGEDFGLMRKLMKWWVKDYNELIELIDKLSAKTKAP